MKTFKQYLEENRLATLAATAGMIAGSALAAPPKPEAVDQATNYIKSKENFISDARPDEIAKGKPLMIGYGTTRTYPDGTPIKLGDKISEEQAAAHLSTHLRNMSKPLEKIPGWDNMSSNQQAALMSFAYNTGSHFYKSKNYETISGHLERQEWDKVPEALKLYNKSDGKVRGGLVTRRREEGEMWSSPQEAKPENNNATTDHQVVKGDTLGAIAKKYGKSVQELQKLNPEITNPDKIKIGQNVKTK